MRPIPNSIAAMAPELAEWRQDLHRHPELGYQETRTQKVVAEKLRAWGLDAVDEGLGETGVVGVLHGRNGPGEAILLRSDMDALPILEETGLGHASETEGTMHACGHDGHMTMLLGAAKHLSETRNFDGTVYFCFQPAEEGGAGAQAMIDDGLFEKFPARSVYGMHNIPGIPVGQFAVSPGAVMASADEFTIRVRGQGGHAALPHETRDPVLAGAEIVVALQSIVSRKVDPLSPAVLSVSTFHAGTISNVIPDEAVMTGTVRTLDARVYELIKAEMERVCARVAEAHGVAATIEREGVPYPATVNDTAETRFVAGVLEGLVGPEMVETGRAPTMGGEDFSFMAEAKPGCFVFIGNGDSAALHNARYDFNDDAAPYGVAYWARLVEEALPIRS